MIAVGIAIAIVIVANCTVAIITHNFNSSWNPIDNLGYSDHLIQLYFYSYQVL